MTIVKTYYQIEYCIPQAQTAEEWTMMKTEYPDLHHVEKKLGFFRTEYPGRRWRVWYVEKKDSLHLSIGE